MKRFFIYQLLAVSLSIIYQNCNEGPRESPSEITQLENNSIEKSENSIQITQKQAEIIDLQWQVPAERSLGNSIAVTGKLELFPQDKANISPFIGGNVRKIQVIEGDEVREGSVMAYLEHPDIISIQQEFQEKYNQLRYLERDFERKKTLYNKGVSSGKDFQNAESDFLTTQSSVNALKAKLELLGLRADQVAAGTIYPTIPIRTPITGFVDEVMINLGDYVEPQAKMFTVSDNSKIHLDLKVYEKDIRNVEKDQQIYFSVTSKPDEILEAKIHSIGKSFESDPQAVHIHAHIDNKDHDLLPGMYVEGRIVQEKQNTIAIPEEAVVKEGDNSYVFALDKSRKSQDGMLSFKQIKVQTGTIDLGYIAIHLPETMTEGTPIVTRGAYALSSEIGKGSTAQAH